MAMAHAVEDSTEVTGFAIRGYDPVAYLTEGCPTAGHCDLSVEYKGETYLFATTANRDAFEANPQKYVPQNGGY